MALSDACFEFLETVGTAARELAEAVHWYSDPVSPLRYGEEIDALRRACVKVADGPYDPEAGAQLLRLAASVMRYHDTPPGIPEESRRQAEMMALIRLLQSNLDTEDAAAVPAVVQNIVHETPFTQQAAVRLKSMLSKLGKPAYDAAIKVISDVASAIVRKTLGL